jgi:hypothetical protein
MITKREAAIIGAYTGVTLGPFEDIAALAAEVLGRSISARGLSWGGEPLVSELREAVRPLFMALPVEGVKEGVV